ncbi:MAG: hypothetical protein BroJett021_46300 [Chloroflexota bacterium]|nr:MAG: hypothetical protein BroJett021_46300 [Chloroflexota bacterium]
MPDYKIDAEIPMEPGSLGTCMVIAIDPQVGRIAQELPMPQETTKTVNMVTNISTNPFIRSAIAPSA